MTLKMTRKWMAVLAVGLLAAQVRAEEPLIPKPQEQNADTTYAVGEILTAIDVADLINRGSSDADIAELLSSQRGFDRVSALNKGNSDEQIIKYLLTNTKRAKDLIDDNKSIRHKTEGDKYYNASQYDKAAKEYSLAIKYSKANFEQHKLRADTYKQYLIAEMSPLSGSSLEPAKHILFNKTRTLLCNATYSDYRRAIKINADAIQDNITDLNALQYKMKDENMNNTENDMNALPYYGKAAQKTLDMRRLRKLYQSQRAFKQADSDIWKAVSDYKLVCREEDAASREFIKTEKDKRRDPKWLKYGEAKETSYFYDKSSIAKSKEYLKVWTRREKMNDAGSYDAAQVVINCKMRTIGTIESMSYDEMGNLVSQYHNEDEAVKILRLPDSNEEMLLKEICK